MRILMCAPEYYGLEYEINPWMDMKVKVDRELAFAQWKNLYQTITESGTEVVLLDPAPHWPDMVFTANAGLPYKRKIILSHFKYKERQGEVPYFKKWFLDANYEILFDSMLNPNLPHFEGAGDALFAGRKLFAGYGFRTDRQFYSEMPDLNNLQLFFCELVDPYFYHIDTCFCPLNDRQAIWYPYAFSPESRKKIQNELDLIEVDEKEAKNFACNSVVLDQTIIIPARCPELAKKLQQLNLNVKACEMSEFIKAGGACKCLTLSLESV